MFFASNLKLLRGRRNISQGDLASSLGLTRSSVSAYEIQTAQPNLETLIKFSDYFKVSVDKLLRVEMSKISERLLSELEKGHDIDIKGNRLRVLTTTVDKKNDDNIELVSIKAKAGYTAGYSDPEYIKELSTFNLPFLDKNKKYRGFQIDGDSMPPVPHKGWVIGEYLQNWNDIKDGQPYIILTKEDGVVFKVVFNKIIETESLLLCSTNLVYEPYDVDIQEVFEVWKFKQYISQELI